MASSSRAPWTFTLPWNSGQMVICSTSGACPWDLLTMELHSTCKLEGLETLGERLVCMHLTRGRPDGDCVAQSRGQMSAEEVTIIMWQLLQALKFLHLNNVWHR